MNKRVLILGYFFPDANMGGVRLRRLVRHLPRHGWDPVVLTHPGEAKTGIDSNPNIRVEEIAAPDLARVYRRLSRLGRRSPATVPAAARPEPVARDIGLTSKINRWLMIPDKQMPWRRPAVRRGRELLERETFDVIFASLEPRTCALAAAQLSRQTGVPCVIEYRDLWTDNPYYHVTQPTRWHRWLHARLERKALRQARRVTAVCRGIADYLAQNHADVLRAPVGRNYNFFDPDEYPPLAPEDAPAAAGRPFIISYTGALYGQRRPDRFFEGMRRFIDQSGLTPEQFKFRWAGGAVDLRDLGDLLDRTGVRPYLDFLGYVPHADALRLLRQSHAALLVQAPDDAIHIPGKLFEALGARVPLLALANPCEVTDIIQRCHAGIVCPHTAESVAQALTEFHRLAGVSQAWTFAEAERQRFSGENAVGQLAALLDEAAG